MVLACQNISKSFGTDEIIRNATFHVEEREKVAIVGMNGAGKSTLLKIITKELSQDEGEVVLAKNANIGYLAQYQTAEEKKTILEEVLSARPDILDMEAKIRQMEEDMTHVQGDDLNNLLERYHRLDHEYSLAGGYSYRSEVNGIIKGLGFSEEDFNRPLSELSGGQKTRVSLGKLLISKPDVLLLDEPTNHLDISSITWLETYLLNYPGAVIIVSHDRYFLDRIVTKVVEIFQHQVYTYSGNYTEFAQKKSMIREAQMKAYLNQQRELKHQEEVITKLKSFNREKSIKRAESREKMLEKIERLEKPVDENTDIKIKLEPKITSGNDVLKVENLAKAFESNELFKDISFEIKRGERIALIGDNGTGKTTILKIINGIISADAGKIELGSNVQIGYYDQEQQVLSDDKTLFDEISDQHPEMTNTQVRNILAAFLFTGDDVYKRIGDLSGGERGRVSLAKLMLSEANLLILDEPTNHLDVTSKEILEDALNQYTGTVLFVSHDRYFVNRTATRILDLTKQTLVNYIGNYDYYMEKRDVQMKAIEAEFAQDETAPAQAETIEQTKSDWKAQKEEQARQRKLANDLKRTEDKITELEEQKSALENELTLPENVTNSAKLNEINSKMLEIDDELETLYETWETLSMEEI